MNSNIRGQEVRESQVSHNSLKIISEAATAGTKKNAFKNFSKSCSFSSISSTCSATESISAIHISQDLYSCSSSEDENFEKVKCFEKPTLKQQIVFDVSLLDKTGRYKEVEKLINQFVRVQELPADTLIYRSFHLEKQAFQALKNYTFVKRTQNKILDTIMKNEKESEHNGSKRSIRLIKLYRNMIRKESIVHCNKAISLLLDVLLPKATNMKMKIFYMKMAADYCRYNSEFNDLLHQDKYKQKAEQLYVDAINMAYNSLTAYDTILLTAALNYATFNYEALNNKEKAINIAKKAFNNAIEQIDDISDSDYKEAVVLLYIIKDNINTWQQSFYEQKSIFII